MRKLLIKLVAIETALVGWLSYWLFLVYANNPDVASQLSSSLQRLPQLSFSTIDIAVLVIIAALAVTLAFKFQRGLRPGIRLERALQMLENLMKRNLVLEAQVAELKIEKSHVPPVITSAPPPVVSTVEPRPGSWEKAFRTPLEAGPPTSSRSSRTSNDEIPFSSETGIPPPRIEAKTLSTPQMTKPTVVINDKGSEKTLPPSPAPPEKTNISNYPKKPSNTWEDSPQLISDSRGILTPSPQPRRVPTVSDSGGLKQPYIPAPAPKTPPPSVIVGPLVAPTAPKITPPSLSAKITARPASRSSNARPFAPSLSTDPSTTDPTKTGATPPTPDPLPTSSSSKPVSPNDPSPTTSLPAPETGESDEKPVTKDTDAAGQPTRRKSSTEK